MEVRVGWWWCSVVVVVQWCCWWCSGGGDGAGPLNRHASRVCVYLAN